MKTGRTFSWRDFFSGLLKSASFLVFYAAGYLTANISSELQIADLQRHMEALTAQVDSYKESINKIDQLQKELVELKQSHEALKESNRLLANRIEEKLRAP